MIQVATVSGLSPRVVQRPGGLLRLMDTLKDEAAMELGAAFEGATGKKIVTAAVPGASKFWLSRATNGDSNNPLFRLVAVFVLMKRLGMGRERALRLLGWLGEMIDAIWPEGEAADLQDVLEKDQALDVKDDSLRFRAALGCMDAARELLTVKRIQMAYSPSVVIALRRQIAGHG